MSRRRVVVTGMGIVSPVGNDVATAWDNLIAGRSGITNITKFDASAYSCNIAGEVKGFDVLAYLGSKEARTMDTFIHYGLAAGIQAFRDSGITVTEENAERIGVAIGSGIGGLPMIEENTETMVNKGMRRVSPFMIPGSIINMISGHMSIMHGLKGPNIAIVTACTTGTHCIGEAARMIQYGDADVMVAGGAEATVSRLAIAGFGNMRALSTRNDDPAAASRPWDAERDGFVLGEGAGVLVLEEYEHAKARGAKIYAEIAGYGMSADANHMTAPAEDGDGGRRAMVNAMKDAKVNADEVNYINAHGTSTPLGDLA
ncbi:MAG: beta-ketoacyl-ACP synthase II, partial [Formosimonas sp.]